MCIRLWKEGRVYVGGEGRPHKKLKTNRKLSNMFCLSFFLQSCFKAQRVYFVYCQTEIFFLISFSFVDLNLSVFAIPTHKRLMQIENPSFAPSRADIPTQ